MPKQTTPLQPPARTLADGHPLNFARDQCTKMVTINRNRVKTSLSSKNIGRKRVGVRAGRTAGLQLVWDQPGNRGRRARHPAGARARTPVNRGRGGGCPGTMEPRRHGRTSARDAAFQRKAGKETLPPGTGPRFRKENFWRRSTQRKAIDRARSQGGSSRHDARFFVDARGGETAGDGFSLVNGSISDGPETDRPRESRPRGSCPRTAGSMARNGRVRSRIPGERSARGPYADTGCGTGSG